jgi:hypothetical protein
MPTHPPSPALRRRAATLAPSPRRRPTHR